MAEKTELDFFDEEGDLQFWLASKAYRDHETLTGLEALAFLADEFAGETHGNYCAETLYRRMSKSGIEISVRIT